MNKYCRSVFNQFTIALFRCLCGKVAFSCSILLLAIITWLLFYCKRKHLRFTRNSRATVTINEKVILANISINLNRLTCPLSLNFQHQPQQIYLYISATTGIHFPKLSGRNNIEIVFMYSHCGGDWKKVSCLFFVANFELFVICLKTGTTIKRHFLVFIKNDFFAPCFKTGILISKGGEQDKTSGLLERKELLCCTNQVSLHSISFCFFLLYL